MRLQCPECGKRFAAADAAEDDCARQFMAMLAEPPLSAVASLLIVYLGLFRPRKQQVLRWSRAWQFSEEIRDAMAAGKLHRRGRPHELQTFHWIKGFESVLFARDRGALNLPLRSNGYLFEIVCAAMKREAIVGRGMVPPSGARAQAISELEKERRG